MQTLQPQSPSRGLRWWDMDILWPPVNISQHNLLQTYRSCGRKSLCATFVPVDPSNRGGVRVFTPRTLPAPPRLHGASLHQELSAIHVYTPNDLIHVNKKWFLFSQSISNPLGSCSAISVFVWLAAANPCLLEAERTDCFCLCVFAGLNRDTHQALNRQE